MKYLSQPILFLCMLILLQSCVDSGAKNEQSSESTPTPSADHSMDHSSADSDDSNDSNNYKVKPIGLIPEALGPYSWKVTTSNTKAQQYFDQGVQLKYAFAVNEAASSFREAQKLDPDCAMCYWGEAWALGSYLNGHMRANKAPVALVAINKALAKTESLEDGIEKDLIEAMEVRYIEDYVYDERRTQDSLFAIAMSKVYQNHTGNLDVASVYAEALFLLEPRRGMRDLNDPGVIKLHQVLEKALESDITHPGACHLYIHATESTLKPELGAGCADYLGNAIPGASHINHMPSHTWNEIGQWGKSVRANLQAVHSDQKAKEGKAFAIYPSHNLHMLLYSAAYDGQGAIAIQAGKDYSKLGGNTMFEALTLLRFGRYEEVLNVKKEPTSEIPKGFWDFAQGYARLKTGEIDFAQLHLSRVQKVSESSKAEYRWHTAAQLLGVLALILEGEIEKEAGNSQKSIDLFRQAVKIEDDYPFSEPEPFPFAARHWLGQALLDVNNFTEAEKVFRNELADHPRNGWSAFGLLEALKGQGKPLDEEKKLFDESWARSDTWITGSVL